MMSRDQYKGLPTYTIRALGIGKLYIVNDPQLIAVIQRQQRAFTFQAVQDRFSSRICDLSSAAIAVQKREADAWLEGPAHAPSPSALAFTGLKPGRCLNGMNRMMVQAMQKTLETMVTGSGQSVGLFEWIKEGLPLRRLKVYTAVQILIATPKCGKFSGITSKHLQRTTLINDQDVQCRCHHDGCWTHRQNARQRQHVSSQIHRRHLREVLRNRSSPRRIRPHPATQRVVP
jgi:hypothetical protein